MNCPKCKAEMEKVKFQGVEVDRCSVCQGIWFDRLEHEELKELNGSEIVDTGDPEKGKRFNEIDKIDCPECKTLMIRLVDNAQPHIWYEACTICGGVYFDAGEFTDFKDYTAMDFFKKILNKERT